MPLARWLYDNDPTGFHKAIYETPMETWCLALELAIGIAGAEFLVIFLGDAIIAAGAAGVEAVASKLGSGVMTDVLGTLLSQGRWAEALKLILDALWVKVAAASGLSELTISLTPASIMALAKLLAWINGIGFAANWLAKEGVAETILYGVDNLIKNEDYETALKTLEDSKTNFDLAMDSIKVFSYANFLLKQAWDASVEEYYRRYSTLKKQCEDALAEIPPGVGVGQSLITLITDPAAVHVKTTIFDEDVTTPKSWIVNQATYDVIVTAPGYIERKVTYYCTRRLPYEQNITLLRSEEEPLPNQGIVNVSIYDAEGNYPMNAAIYVDDVLEGTAFTTLQLILDEGTHTIRAEASGYITQSKSVTVAAGSTQEIKFSMVKSAVTPPPETTPTQGTLSISIYEAATGNPLAANLSVDGILESYVSNAYKIVKEQGVHSFKIEKSGYISEEFSYNIVAQTEASKVVYLRQAAPPPPPEAITGIVSIATVPSGARIYINEILQPYLSPQRYEMDAGTYVFKVTKEGYEDYSETLKVEEGKQYARTYVMKGIVTTPQQTAWKVSILSTPSGAKILVNYEVTGKYTPDYVILNPGTYTIRVEKTGYYPAEKEITLEAF